LCQVKTSVTVLSSFLQLHKWFVNLMTQYFAIWQVNAHICSSCFYYNFNTYSNRHGDEPLAWLNLWAKKVYGQPAGSTRYEFELFGLVVSVYDVASWNAIKCAKQKTEFHICCYVFLFNEPLEGKQRSLWNDMRLTRSNQ